MSILSINVPVPVSGDGAAVNIENIVGEKTVQLSGLFEGYYDLLASHDGTDYVPVTSFDVSGTGEIKQTIAGAFKLVRLRSGARAISAVVCEISGVEGTGENGFGTIASIGAGFSGLTPIVDTATFISPSGSEDDTNFICRGDFTGAIVVLGSIDGVEFNPLGEFNVSRRPEGSPAVLELSPLLTRATLRYVRLQVPGTVTGPVVVTMGGRVPATGGGPVGTNMPIVVVDRTAVNYLALGTVVALGYQAGSVLAGDPLTVSTTNTAAVVVVGANLTLGANSAESSLIGSHSSSIGPFAAMLGPYQINSGANSVAMLGTGNKVRALSHNGTTLGTGNEIMAGAAQCLAAGNSNTIGIGDDVNPSDNYVVGTASQVGDSCLRCVIFGGSDALANVVATLCTDVSIVGNSTNVGQGSTFINASGAANAVGQTGHNAVLSGFHLTVSDTCSEVVLIGYSLSLTTTEQSKIVNIGSVNVVQGNVPVLGDTATTKIVVVGALNTIGNTTVNTQYATVLGSDNSSGEGGDHLVVAGASNTIGVSVAFSAVCGFSNNVSDNSSQTHVFGNDCNVGSTVTNATVAGDHVTISNTCTEVVMIGYSVTLTTTEQSKIVNIGSVNVVQGNVPVLGDTATTKIVVVGALNTIGNTTVNTQYATVLGSDNTSGEGGDHLVVAGASNTIGVSVEFSAVCGFSNNVSDNSSQTHVFGNDCNVGNTVTNATVAGDHVTISNTCTEVVMIGYSVTLTTTEQSKIVNIGSVNVVQGSTPDESVRTEKIVVIGSLNTVGDTDSNSSLVTILGSDNTMGSGTTSLVMVGSGNQSAVNVLTSEMVGFVNQVTAGCQNISVLGQSNIVTAPAEFAAYDLIVVGNANGLTCLLAAGLATLHDTIVMGFSNAVTNLTTCTIIGQNNTISSAFGTSEIVVVGSLNQTVEAGGSIILGSRNILPTGAGSVLIVGSGSIQGAGTCGHGAILIGNGATTTANADFSIAIGTDAVSGDNQCVIGRSNPAVTFEAIHNFVVRGLDMSGPTAIDTLNVIDNPADGSTGLTIVYNAAGTYSNKTVSAISVATIADLTGKLVCYLS